MNKKTLKAKVRLEVLSRLDDYRDRPCIDYDEGGLQYCLQRFVGLELVEEWVDRDIPLSPEVTIFNKVNDQYLIEVCVEGSFCDRFYFPFIKKGSLIEEEDYDDIFAADPNLSFEELFKDIDYSYKEVQMEEAVQPTVFMKFSIDESEFRAFEKDSQKVSRYLKLLSLNT
jgi:hypothetical protein